MAELEALIASEKERGANADSLLAIVRNCIGEFDPPPTKGQEKTA